MSLRVKFHYRDRVEVYVSGTWQPGWIQKVFYHHGGYCVVLDSTEEKVSVGWDSVRTLKSVPQPTT